MSANKFLTYDSRQESLHESWTSDKNKNAREQLNIKLTWRELLSSEAKPENYVCLRSSINS